MVGTDRSLPTSAFGSQYGHPPSKGGSAPASGGGTKYLGGLPSNYQPNYQPYITSQFPKGHQYMGAGGRESVKPRYAAGDEWTQILGLGTETLASIQQSMAQAGMLKPGSFSPGAPDSNTRKAVTELLTEANANGMTWLDYLGQRGQIADQIRAHGGNPSGGGSAGPTKAPLQINLTNPDTIKAQVTADVPNLIGTADPSMSPDQYVNQIQGQERLQQTEQYNQTGAGFAGGTGGTTADAPTVDALAIQNNPGQYKAFQLGQHGQEILDALTRQTPGGGQFSV